MGNVNKWDGIADVTWNVFKKTPFGGKDSKYFNMNWDDERDEALDQIMEIKL